MSKMLRRVGSVLAVGALLTACGAAEKLGVSASTPTAGSVSSGADTPLPPEAAAGTWPSVPARQAKEGAYTWGSTPDGEVAIPLTAAKTVTDANKLIAASAALSYTPQIMPGADVAPLVFSPPAESNSGEQVELFYPSPTVGWYGVWMARAGADADQSLLDDAAACDQPETECAPSKPTLVKLSTGATALLNDPGGVRWTQGGVMYTVAGPWASFSADLAMPLANALSEAIAKG